MHRHLDYAPDTPAEELPSAAIVDILDRGDLGDWKPIAAAVARDPYGPFAERVLQLVNAHPMYGTSTLWRNWIERRRVFTDGRRSRWQRPAPLATIRRRVNLTQREVADRMGMSQSDLSKLERRDDIRVSTLAEYAKAVGGEAHLVFTFPGEDIEAAVGGDTAS